MTNKCKIMSHCTSHGNDVYYLSGYYILTGREIDLEIRDPVILKEWGRGKEQKNSNL